MKIKMCGIAGAIINNVREAEKFLLETQERGRDSFGVSGIVNGKVWRWKGLKPDSFSLPEGIKIAIAESRAEPTTEWVKEKKHADIPPFDDGFWFVAHNGTISNDKILKEKYKIQTQTIIDSALLPNLFTRKGFSSIKEIEGNFAIIAFNTEEDYIYLTNNYRPLYVIRDLDSRNLYIASRPWRVKGLDFRYQVFQVPGYSAYKCNEEKCFELFKLEREMDPQRRVLVIASGGLDSTVTAKILEDNNYKPILLHFNYGHRALKKEREAIRKISEKMGWDLIEVDMNFFSDFIKSSSLLNRLKPITRLERSAEFPHEWVPSRNLIFASLAVGLAEELGVNYVSLGINMEESNYPDNEPEAYEKLNEILHYFVAPNKYVRIINPVGNLVKHEIVKEGVERGAPLELTWSCYEDGDKHCGICGPCYMRKRAFEMNGLDDPVFKRE